MKRIFVIGPNKCATGSLHEFFNKNGLSSVHWDDGNLAKRMLTNISCGLDPIAGYEEYNCFLDFYLSTEDIFISPLLIREHIVKKYPKAIYILNTRNFESWDNSRNRHDNGSFAKRMNECLGREYDAKTEFDSYSDIKNLNIENLHVFNLEDDNKFEKLASYLSGKGIEIQYSEAVIENVSDKLYK